VVILATSRTVLGLAAEREYPVPPLPLPAHAALVDELASSPAVALFVDRARAARPDAAEIQCRHAEYYRALTEQADRPLRGVGQGEWMERLEAEAGNLAAAVRWYLAHDRAPLPHLFRILWPFLSMRDHLAEARAWVDQLLPAAGSLDPQAQAELGWVAAGTASEVGDDAAALAARRRLTPLLEEIQDPFLHAVCQLAMAWSSPITGDFDGALREVSASLEELRGQDEPFWTALAAYTAAVLETALGRYDDALHRLRETRGLADRFGYAWLTANSQLQLGTLAVMQGRLDQARELLEEALDVSLANRITRGVTTCLAAFAQLAFAEGGPERAALLAGAAEGLRGRAGLRTWATVRRGEAELAAQVRQALGDGHRPGSAAVHRKRGRAPGRAASRCAHQPRGRGGRVAGGTY
jgi:tetratricopeptide (TPR) repeat protein